MIKKVIYNNGKNEGYFIETSKGFVQIKINEGEAFELPKIKKIVNIKISEVNLRAEEVTENAKYIN